MAFPFPVNAVLATVILDGMATSTTINVTFASLSYVFLVVFLIVVIAVFIVLLLCVLLQLMRYLLLFTTHLCSNE